MCCREQTRDELGGSENGRELAKRGGELARRDGELIRGAENSKINWRGFFQNGELPYAQIYSIQYKVIHIRGLRIYK